MSYFNLDILIVEDNHTYRTLILSALRDQRCRTATTYLEGKKQANSQPSHVYFIDINLPDGNGLELLKEIVDQEPESYCAILTGSASPDDVSRAQAYGAMEYIIKPFTTSRIQDTLQHYTSYINKINSLSQEERELQLAKRFAQSAIALQKIKKDNEA